MRIKNTMMLILLFIFILPFLFGSNCDSGGNNKGPFCGLIFLMIISLILMILLFIPWVVTFIYDLSKSKNTSNNKPRMNNSQNNNSRNA